ncbi:hypothetical protein [Asaia sp. HumB]|uniref:hypothetical protein n=1 Tax=Asaia sp. HumB TaxID=3035475 RepID=UPI0025544707|nr:hypothetical protein [Asaia sp. HumB]MDL2172432.1 hypothetical protein [Asaia sp. HumB]
MSGKWTPESAKPIAWCLMTADRQIINGIHAEKSHAEAYQHRRGSDALTALYTCLDNAITSELAEALEAMIERFGHDIFTMPPEDRDLLTRAVAALAKAKGEGA